MKPTLHIVGLPHNQANKEFVSCAYGQKHLKFCNMMTALGYDVVSYYGEHSDMNATEHVVIYSDIDQKRWFGDYDYHNKFYPITWGPNDTHWVEGNENAIREIRKRIQPKDIILLIAGECQHAIADAFPSHLVVEYGIGYKGVFANHKVFESYAWMHYVYGLLQYETGGYFDAVIPNYFEESDFTFNDSPEDYLLFVGRLIQNKGPHVAADIARRAGKKLVLAGQGVHHQEPGLIIAQDGTRIEGDVEHVGHVNVEERNELMSKALATIVPTIYIEPFGGVSIESLMCGTPVIAPDFGVFTETIPHGEVGYRFRTLGEGTKAVELCSDLSRSYVRQYASRNFSTDVIRWKYDQYFQQINTLWEEGFYSDHVDSSYAMRYRKV